MPEALIFRLPWSSGTNVNHQYIPRFDVRQGKVTAAKRLSPAAKAWLQLICDTVALGRPTPPEGAKELSIWFCPPNHRRYDADGKLKLLLDGLALGLGFDDSEITALHAYKCEAKAPGSIWLRLESGAIYLPPVT